MRKRHNKGFTLVEVITAIALLGIISLFLLPMSIQALQFSKWNNIKLTAMNLAYTQVEWLKTLDYNYDLGLNLPGYSPSGIVSEKLFLNEAGSDPKTIEGIDYSLLTSIYWESEEASDGDFVATANKKADVTIKARDPISGKERTFSVIGTLIAFEGERTLTNNVPLKTRVITGEDFTEPAKNVKVIVNNLSNTMVTWSRTDEKGEAFFANLTNAKYNVYPAEWEKGDMTARPTGITGTVDNEDWQYQVQLEVKVTENDYIEQIFFVDHPAFIVLTGYPESLMNSSYVKLAPIYDPPEGDMAVYDLDTSLTKLLSKKIWRAWEYEHSITDGASNYYFVEKDSGNLWDGKFDYLEGKATEKELKLAFGLKEGSFKKETDGSITLTVEFTSEISGIDTMLFSLYEGSTVIEYSDILINRAVSGANNKFLINVKTPYSIISDTLKFEIDNKEADTLINSYGMKLVQDRNYCSLIKN